MPDLSISSKVECPLLPGNAPIWVTVGVYDFVLICLALRDNLAVQSNDEMRSVVSRVVPAQDDLDPLKGKKSPRLPPPLVIAYHHARDWGVVTGRRVYNTWAPKRFEPKVIQLKIPLLKLVRRLQIWK
ncbi:hypothetical protein CC78DRAFT_580502 [Lojkania enalia]|uniref:Uncharacterized protein n=1 Tax=Lojkania enalia TaxID=147567 RepID=A0A9P4K7W6_9PLEO|nr:hypothetical protein CC78DRAFT_580502 [Didymosphaeria enalia]